MRFNLSLSMMLLAACGPEGSPGSRDADTGISSLPADQAPAVLRSSPEWDLLTSFDEHPVLGTGALYGRATARTSTSTGRCSGSLIDDDIMITADHCGSGGTMTAIFGEHGLDNWNHNRGINDARLRLRQMGVPLHVERGLADATLTDFTCSWESQDGSRDVAYWECPGNLITWTSGAETYRYLIKPGHLWGHYNVRVGSRGEGRDVYAVSVNRTCAHSNLNTLLSPGEVDDRSDNCNSSHTGCFDVTADWTSGSSGGIIVDQTTHEAFGIINGHNWWWLGDPNDPCDRWSAANNTGSYIGSGIYDYLGEDADGAGWPVGNWVGSTGWVGATTGNRDDMFCPEDMMVAGVVGSTGDDGTVGNFGMVCVPHNAPDKLRMDRATVIAGGSLDTGFGLARNMDFNTYMHEVVSSNVPITGVQTLAMCPAGSFVYRIQAKTDRFVNSITRLYCQDPQDGKRVMVRLGDPWDGVGQIGTDETGSWAYAACPRTGSYLAGFRIHHGWLTDGFSGFCRYED
jgi:hypothetical protein